MIVMLDNYWAIMPESIRCISRRYPIMLGIDRLTQWVD